MANKTIEKITNLLDFSEWSLGDIKDLSPLNDAELTQMEDLLTNSIDDMSQFDHVRLAITYKLKIKELQTENARLKRQ